MLSTMVILYIQCHKVACQEFYLNKEGRNEKRAFAIKAPKLLILLVGREGIEPSTY